VETKTSERCFLPLFSDLEQVFVGLMLSKNLFKVQEKGAETKKSLRGPERLLQARVWSSGFDSFWMLFLYSVFVSDFSRCSVFISDMFFRRSGFVPDIVPICSAFRFHSIVSQWSNTRSKSAK